MRLLFVLSVLLLLAGASYAQPVNVRVSDPGLRDPEEVSIALNPKNLNQLAVGANIRYSFTSTDGGFSWNTGVIDQQHGVWGDPCLMFDDSGILYFEHLSGHNWQDPEFLWRIDVQRSLDPATYDTGAETGYAPPTMQDKAWLSLDRSPTAQHGNIYTSWTEFDRYGSHSPFDSSRIYFSKTTDHGASWSDRVRVDDTAGDCLDSSLTDEGATTAACKDGSIVCAWSAHDQIYLDRSTDGGKTFGKDRIVTDQPRGWNFAVPGIFRANGFAMIASDPNPSSVYYGRLYLMWSDQRRGVTDVYIKHSTDNGETWSERLRVNSDSTLKEHFFPSMAVDPVTGRIYIVYYDRRYYDDVRTDVYLARSIDGGASFTDGRISESVFSPADSVFFGDYIHIVAHAGRVHPVWMREDFDPSPKLSVWTATIVDTGNAKMPFATVGVRANIADEISVLNNGVHPTLAISLAKFEHVSIELYDLLGRRVEQLLAGDYGTGEYRIGIPENIPSGTYVARMTAISQTNDAPSGFSTLVTKIVIP
jgi:hypothetical protein